MSFEEAIERASRDEAFRATLYAINSLLIHKGIYTQQEFSQLFTEWVEKEERKKKRNSSPSSPTPNPRPHAMA